MMSPSSEKSSPLLMLLPGPHGSSVSLDALLPPDRRGARGTSTVSMWPATMSRIAAFSEPSLLLVCSSSPCSYLTSCSPIKNEV